MWGITQQNLEFPHAPSCTAASSPSWRAAMPSPETLRASSKLIEDGQLDTRPWITHHSSFEEMPSVFPSWLKPENGVIKAVVHIGLTLHLPVYEPTEEEVHELHELHENSRRILRLQKLSLLLFVRFVSFVDDLFLTFHFRKRLSFSPMNTDPLKTHLLSSPGIPLPAAFAGDRMTYEPKPGPGHGNTIVLLSGDEEYRTSEGMPMLGKYSASWHGFKCTVLFSLDRMDHQPEQSASLAGADALDRRRDRHAHRASGNGRRRC